MIPMFKVFLGKMEKKYRNILVLSLRNYQKLCSKKKEKKDLLLFICLKRTLELAEYSKMKLDQEQNLKINITIIINQKDNSNTQMTKKNKIKRLKTGNMFQLTKEISNFPRMMNKSNKQISIIKNNLQTNQTFKKNPNLTNLKQIKILKEILLTLKKSLILI